MKKKKADLKIVHKKELEPKSTDSEDMVTIIHDELSEIVDILEAEFAKPLSDAGETSDGPNTSTRCTPSE